jgi:hypothetical protein
MTDNAISFLYAYFSFQLSSHKLFISISLSSSKDLIKFLQSSGPLERTIDQDLTSPKVYESLIADEKAKNDQAKKANERTTRRMPIMSGGKVNASKLDGLIGGVNSGAAGDASIDSGEDDGSMTTRTTNFSTLDRSNRLEGFGIHRRNLFDLSIKLHGLATDSDEWKKLVSQEFQTLSNADVPRSEEQMDKDLALLQDTMRYISVPILMRDSGDTDEDVIGIAYDRVKILQMSGLKLARDNSLRFIMLDEATEV